MRNLTFKKRLLTSSIAVVVASGMSYQAFAQDDAVEEVVVTGIKASLQNAVSIKRDAAGVVDAISSEDIGKLPDANLAESLQRITGISIDRTNGEGSRVTSRGFGPEFNLITLNGRQLSSASIGEGYDIDSSRSFDMSNIASESVSGVEVYKTGKASIPTGGIGATVNLKTAKPFDHEGFKASIGGKALADMSSDINEKITPELSGFASWSNEMFGASLSLTHQERNSGRSGVSTQDWNSYIRPYSGSTIFPEVSNQPAGYVVKHVNEPKAGELANTTPAMRYFHTDSSRVRDNALLTLQFRPLENVTATLDYLSTVTKAKSQEAVYSYWFGGGSFPATNVQWDTNSIIKTPIYFWAENPSGQTRDVALGNSLRSNKNKLEDIGFNVAVEATDALTLDFDVHHSKSKSTPWNEPGSNITLGLGAQGVNAQGWDLSGDLPLLVGVYDDVNNKVMGKEDVGSTVRQIRNARVEADVTQARFSGEYKFADTGSIDFGIDAMAAESIQKSSFSQDLMRGGWNVATAGDVDKNWIETINFKDYFGGYRTNLTADGRKFFDNAGTRGNKAVVPMTGIRVKYFDVLGKKLSEDAGLAWAPNPVDGTDRKINEDINAAYVQTNLEGTLGDMKVNVSAGVRYETTDVEAAARVASRTIEWQGDNDFNGVDGSAANAPLVKNTYHYNHILPNIDLSFHITDDLIARASSSKTIARANYADLQQGAAGNAPSGGPLSVGGINAGNNDGNIKLKPIESNNLDFSVEYYFNSTDYVSVGYFNKRVPNFIGRASEVRTMTGTLDPSSGPRAQAAIAELAKRGIQLNQQNLFQMVASMNSTSNGCRNATGVDLCGKPFDSASYTQWENGVDILPVAGDPSVVNNVLTPVNSKDAELSGWEFAAQHFFGESGFGLQANYTIVNGSISYDLKAAPKTTQFALTGLSDTANLVAIYEKDQWQARVAYNWRDKFLDNGNVGNGEPGFTDKYSQVDVSVGYKFTDDFTVTLEGTNVLGEDKRAFTRSDRELRYIDLLEARYSLSARYNF